MNEQVHANEQSDLQRMREKLKLAVLSLSEEEREELLQMIKGDAYAKNAGEPELVR